jgi:serine/threonine protein kinase
LEVLSKAAISGSLGDEFCAIQYETLELLSTKLRVADQKIKSVITNIGPEDAQVRVQRLKYALVQQKIDKSIQELELWQQIFDPSWYMILKTATPQIDAALDSYRNVSSKTVGAPVSSAQSLRTALDPARSSKTPIWLSEDGLEHVHFEDIPLSSAKQGIRDNPEKSLIIETIQPIPGANAKRFERDIRDLARKLAHSNPLEFGLLKCKGVIRHNSGSRAEGGPAFTFVFRLPPGYMEPCSLRKSLSDRRQTDSLSDRFKLARDLTKSVGSIHIFGFVHKDIRPETILIMTKDAPSSSAAFLVGFDSFRTAEGMTLRKGDLPWKRCLYQHPSRMGSTPTEDYIMQHDIYSLGVCLLEIGLWENFVDYNPEDMFVGHDGSLTGESRSHFLGADLDTSFFKDRLLFLARGELKARMGSRYSEVVVTCLTCLDPDNADFGDEREFQDADGLLVGARYIEKVSDCGFLIGVLDISSADWFRSPCKSTASLFKWLRTHSTYQCQDG